MLRLAGLVTSGPRTQVTVSDIATKLRLFKVPYLTDLPLEAEMKGKVVKLNVNVGVRVLEPCASFTVGMSMEHEKVMRRRLAAATRQQARRMAKWRYSE